MKYLIIVESPAKCKKIEKILNKNFKDNYFKCIATVGHIKNLPKKSISIDIKNNFKPKFSIIRDKYNLKTVNFIKNEKNKCDFVIIATDPDREGEKIGYDIASYLKLDLKKNNIRMTFNAITERDLVHAFNNRTNINIDMVNSQIARRVIDRLIGYKISWLSMSQIQKKASVGRVLSVCTKIIYDNEKKIRNNNNRNTYFKLEGNFFKNKLLLDNFICNNKFKNDKDILKFMKDIRKRDFYIKNISSKKLSKHPPPPYITSTINQDSPYSVKKTSSILQKLYEKGHITYIRTDSTFISKNALDLIKDYITDIYGENYFKLNYYSKKSKNAQEAHECIRPTNFNTKIDDIESSEGKRLYIMIKKRCLASQMKNYEYNSVNISIGIKEIKKYYFSNNYIKSTFAGYKILYDIKDDSKFLKKICLLQINDDVDYKKIIGIENYESKTKRYTEGGLIKKMENEGIGRPSTYGSSVSNIINKGYVEKKDIKGIEVNLKKYIMTRKTINEENFKKIIDNEKNKLIITSLGIKVTEFMINNFNNIIDYKFTNNVENDLDKISLGNKIWNTDIVSKYYNEFMPKVDKLNKELKNKKTSDNLIGSYKNKNFYKFNSRWGPRIIYGELKDSNTLYLKLEKGKVLEEYTIEDAIKLLPKYMGNFENSKIYLYNNFDSSYYAKHNKKNYKLTKKYFYNKNFDDITIDDCINTINYFRNIKK